MEQGVRSPEYVVIKRGPWDIIGWIILIILVIAIIFGCLFAGFIGSICWSIVIIGIICSLALIKK